MQTLENETCVGLLFTRTALFRVKVFVLLYLAETLVSLVSSREHLNGTEQLSNFFQRGHFALLQPAASMSRRSLISPIDGVVVGSLVSRREKLKMSIWSSDRFTLTSQYLVASNTGPSLSIVFHPTTAGLANRPTIFRRDK